MRSHLVPGIALLAGLCVGNPALAQQHDAAAPNIARPNMVLQQVVEGLPKDDKQTVRVNVLEGAFTLELDGRPPLTVKAGEAMVEPPKVAMTGYNRSAAETTRVVIFYVSANDTPFLDMMSH